MHALALSYVRIAIVIKVGSTIQYISTGMGYNLPLFLLACFFVYFSRRLFNV